MASKKSKSTKSKAPAKLPEKEATVMDTRGHKQGSRKAKVHELHDKQGPDAAWVLGKKLGLKEGTLRTWFGHWRHATGKSAKPVKASKLEKIATKSVEAAQSTLQ
jgi:hypothetical protein